MIEKERKFKLKHLLNDLPPLKGPFIIQQAYLLYEESGHLRVRIVDGKAAFICFKTRANDCARNEYEYEIPLLDGLEMFENATYKLKKTRFKTDYKGNSIDIDIFDNGLKVVEIEYAERLLDDEIPDYCGEEVSSNKEYNNFEIAKQYQQEI